MSPTLIRVIVSLLIVLLMAYQAVRALPGSHRRHAFATAGAAFALLTLFNGKVLLDGSNDPGPWMVAVLWVASLLIFTSLALLVLSWRSGEMKTQVAQMHAAMEHERARRAARISERTPETPETPETKGKDQGKR